MRLENLAVIWIPTAAEFQPPKESHLPAETVARGRTPEEGEDGAVGVGLCRVDAAPREHLPPERRDSPSSAEGGGHAGLMAAEKPQRELAASPSASKLPCGTPGTAYGVW